jgi:hypothetical protein
MVDGQEMKIRLNTCLHEATPSVGSGRHSKALQQANRASSNHTLKANYWKRDINLHRRAEHARAQRDCQDIRLHAVELPNPNAKVQFWRRRCAARGFPSIALSSHTTRTASEVVRLSNRANAKHAKSHSTTPAEVANRITFPNSIAVLLVVCQWSSQNP